MNNLWVDDIRTPPSDWKDFYWAKTSGVAIQPDLWYYGVARMIFGHPRFGWIPPTRSDGNGWKA